MCDIQISDKISKTLYTEMRFSQDLYLTQFLTDFGLILDSKSYDQA